MSALLPLLSTFTPKLELPVCPAVSVATAIRVWAPSFVVVLSHVIAHPSVPSVSSARREPSSRAAAVSLRRRPASNPPDLGITTGRLMIRSPSRAAAPQAGSAVHCYAKRPTCFHDTGRLKSALPVDKVCLRDDPKVVKAGRALDRHTVIRPQGQLCRDTADGSCDGGSEHVVEHWDSRRAGHDQKGPAANVLDLAPPHLSTAGILHQGSSRMASRSDAIAACRSASVGGISRYPSAIAVSVV